MSGASIYEQAGPFDASRMDVPELLDREVWLLFAAQHAESSTNPGGDAPTIGEIDQQSRLRDPMRPLRSLHSFTALVPNEGMVLLSDDKRAIATIKSSPENLTYAYARRWGQPNSIPLDTESETTIMPVARDIEPVIEAGIGVVFNNFRNDISGIRITLGLYGLSSAARLRARRYEKVSHYPYKQRDERVIRSAEHMRAFLQLYRDVALASVSGKPELKSIL